MITLKVTARMLTAGIFISAIYAMETSAIAQTGNFKNTRAYKDAFSCAKDSLQEDPSGNSIVAYCIGNSRDPSKIEMQAFKDAAESSKKNPNREN
jgi:hypothetical protein